MQLPIGHYLTATWGEKRNTTITPQGIEEKRPIDKWEGLKWIVMTLVSCLFPKAAEMWPFRGPASFYFSRDAEVSWHVGGNVVIVVQMDPSPNGSLTNGPQ